MLLKERVKSDTIVIQNLNSRSESLILEFVFVDTFQVSSFQVYEYFV